MQNWLEFQLWSACHFLFRSTLKTQQRSKKAQRKILSEMDVTVLEEGGPVPESEEGGVDGFVFVGIQLHVFMGQE